MPISKTIKRLDDHLFINGDGLRVDQHGKPLPMGPGNQSLVVDQEHGPYFTLAAAKAAAVSGDTIFVYPGTYEENDLLKDGVNWHFYAGAIVTWTEPFGDGDGYGIFDDRASGPVTCSVTGNGQFIWRGLDINTATVVPGSGGAALVDANENVVGCIYLEEAASVLYLEADKVGACYYPGNSESAAIWVSNCALCTTHTKVIFNPDEGVVVELEDPLDPGLPIEFRASSIGVYWSNGLTFTNFDLLKMSGYCLYGQQTDAATASDWYVRGMRVESDGVAFYNAGPATSAPNWKIWFDLDEVIAGALGCSFLGNGKFYLTAKKIGITGVSATAVFSFTAGGAEIWANIQKVSGQLQGGGSLVGVLDAFYTGTAFLNIEHLQVTDGTAACVTCNSGTVFLTCQRMETAGNGPAITVGAAGSLVVANAKIVTNATNHATNRSALVAGGGLTLKNVTCVTPALALESVYAAAAQNVAIHGHCMSNKAKHANVTFTPLGVFTVDAAVA